MDYNYIPQPRSEQEFKTEMLGLLEPFKKFKDETASFCKTSNSFYISSKETSFVQNISNFTIESIEKFRYELNYWTQQPFSSKRVIQEKYLITLLGEAQQVHLISLVWLDLATKVKNRSYKPTKVSNKDEVMYNDLIKAFSANFLYFFEIIEAWGKTGEFLSPTEETLKRATALAQLPNSFHDAQNEVVNLLTSENKPGVAYYTAFVQAYTFQSIQCAKLYLSICENNKPN